MNKNIKRKTVFMFVVVLALSSCTNWSSKKRAPADVGVVSIDLLDLSQAVIDKVATREINPQSCEEELELLISDYSSAPAHVDLSEMRNRGQEIINQSFEARMAIHSMLSILPKQCKVLVKNLFLKMRMAEDYVGVHFYNDEQVTAESISYPKEPVPVYEPEKYHPFHVSKGIDPKKKFEFKNGDIIITKGVSFISSTISELATPKSIFSHIVFVHVNGKNVPTTIESYVGRGVSIFTMEDALKNENARILVLRAKDSVMASKAADHMLGRVEKLKEKKKVIPYDYNLDFTDNSKLSCEEVAYDGFKTVSDGKIIIPEVESEVLLDDAKFLKRIGVKKGPMMVPSDMETDSRFEIVLDWTDYRVLRDSWRKDAILGEMFRWIQEYDYRIHENLTSIAAKVVWSSRYTPLVWPLLSKAAGIPTDFMKDIPNLTVSTMASLRGIGAEMLPVLTKADEASFAKNGRWLTTEELRKTLDDFRKTNPKKLRKIFREI
jgi:hypothetical protein